MKKIAIALLVTPITLLAADNEYSSWTGKAELGFVTTTGNTETSSTNGKIDIAYDAGQLLQEFKFEAYKAENDVLVTDPQTNTTQKVTQETANKSYFLSKTGYRYNKASYAFVLVDYEDDNFNGFDYQANFQLGYGHTFFKSKESALSVEGGLGRKRFQKDGSYETVEESVYRFSGKYFTTLSENAKFTQELVADFADSFDTYRSISALSVNINSSMALSVGYEVLHKTEVPVAVPAIEKTDKKTTVNLVYNFL